MSSWGCKAGTFSCFQLISPSQYHNIMPCTQLSRAQRLPCAPGTEVGVIHPGLLLDPEAPVTMPSSINMFVLALVGKTHVSSSSQIPQYSHCLAGCLAWPPVSGHLITFSWQSAGNTESNNGFQAYHQSKGDWVCCVVWCSLMS